MFYGLTEYKENKIEAIYYLIHSGEIVYIGETTDLVQRIEAHRRDKAFQEIYYVDVKGISKRDRLLFESWAMVEFKKCYGRIPKYNKIEEDDTPFKRLKFNHGLGMKYETRLEHQLSRSEYADRPNSEHAMFSRKR